MEAILKRRNPNSLPTLMIAAAAAPENATNNRTAYTEVLESRVKKLEKELDEKDGDTDRLMRGMEQKYHSIKVRYFVTLIMGVLEIMAYLYSFYSRLVLYV